MVCQPLRLALLIGAITAVAVSPVRANFRARGCCDPCGSSSSATAPAFRTVTCTEWVRETYTTTRKAYKTECRTETYDTFRCERVPVCKEQVVSVMKRVPVWTEQTRKVCCNTTVYEDRVVNKTCYKYVQETCMKKQLVRLGHWECREVQPLFGGLGNGGLFGGHGQNRCCDRGCSDPCNNSNACNDTCRPTRTRKVWVHCPEYRECPVTVCKKVCVTTPVTCKVAVCKQVWKEEKVKVCSYKCVEEKCVRKCTVWETRKVACKATRTVRVCVPYEQTVTCCKMVPRTVTRQVPCSNACNNDCCSAPRARLFGNNGCCDSGRGRLFGNGGHGLRCNSDCGRSSCGSGCCN